MFDLLKIDLLKIDLLKIDLLKIDLLKIDLLKIDLLKIDLWPFRVRQQEVDEEERHKNHMDQRMKTLLNLRSDVLSNRVSV